MRKAANLWTGRHLLPISSDDDLQLIMCYQPARSGCFLAVSPGFVVGSVPRFVFYSVAKCFSSGVWSWLSWLCHQRIVQDSNSLSHSSQVARINC